VRTLSDQVGERIAAAIAGQPADGYSISTPLDRADWQHGAGRHLIKPKRKAKRRLTAPPPRSAPRLAGARIQKNRVNAARYRPRSIDPYPAARRRPKPKKKIDAPPPYAPMIVIATPRCPNSIDVVYLLFGYEVSRSTPLYYCNSALRRRIYVSQTKARCRLNTNSGISSNHGTRPGLAATVAKPTGTGDKTNVCGTNRSSAFTLKCEGAQGGNFLRNAALDARVCTLRSSPGRSCGHMQRACRTL